MQHQHSQQTAQSSNQVQNQTSATPNIQHKNNNDGISVETKLSNIFDCIKTSSQIAQIVFLIKDYCQRVVGPYEQELFVNHFVQVRFLEVLLQKLQEFSYESSLLRMTFCFFQILLQAIKKEQNITYLLVTINKLGYISEKYEFSDQQDRPYYAHFLKLLMDKIKQDERYISAFFNSHIAHFPLILSLIKLSNSSDQIMQTESKLALIKICCSSNDMFGKYLLNFPFVIFYPLMIHRIGASLVKILKETQCAAEEALVQDLSSQLMYMKEFIQDKDQVSKDIYANTFLQIICKHIYAIMNDFGQEGADRIKVLIRLLVQRVVPEISVDKIKTCLSLMFSPSTTLSLQNCFQGEPVQMNSCSQLLEQCVQDVIAHCRTIFFEESQDYQTIITTINSYIPWSKDNWLYHQLKKISQLIGMQVSLNVPRSHLYLSDSFLMALLRLYDDVRVVNPLFSTIINQKDEELLYWYLRLVDVLLRERNDCQSFFRLDQIVKQLLSCNSLGLIQSFYNLQLHVTLNGKQSQLQSVYSQLTQRLIKYVMRKGWREFGIKIKLIRLEEKQQNFHHEAYREIQCDILLFVAIRTLLGSSNDKGSRLDTEDWILKADRYNQITFKCQTLHQEDLQLQFILNGQYLCIKDQQGKNIHQEDLLLRNLQFYDGGDGIIQIIGQQSDSWGITVNFSNELKEYILKQIHLRKCLATRIELQLKSMRFQFAQ